MESSNYLETCGSKLCKSCKTDMEKVESMAMVLSHVNQAITIINPENSEGEGFLTDLERVTYPT